MGVGRKMSNKQNVVKKSKFLSLVLRHKPEEIGLTLDDNGWADVQELLKKADMDMETLDEVVATNNKKRFAFNDDHSKIRASQGHSIDIDLQIEPTKPPEHLFHGTATKFLGLIYYKGQGLIAKDRQHVHLSNDREIAVKVGSRHGTPVVLQVDTKLMYEDGYKFYLSDNGVWLTDNVPAKYMKLM